MWYAPKTGSSRRLTMLVFAIAVVSYYFLNDPSTTHLGIPCLLREATGWYCWGCGGQRAFHQLLHGNFEAALKLNALVFPCSILFGYILYAELTEKPFPYRFLRLRVVQIIAVSTMLIYTAWKNLI